MKKIFRSNLQHLAEHLEHRTFANYVVARQSLLSSKIENCAKYINALKMSRLLLIWLFSVLCLANILYIVIAISPQSESIENNGEVKTQMKRKRPHIIIILADDMGWNDVSFHGSDQIPTPNIDALAYNGVILNNHYVLPQCTPSRSALMTGKDPIHLGMQHSVLLASEPRGLPLTEKLLPQYLKEIRYKTHIVGKWHLGFYKHEYTPTYRGFDTHFGYWNGQQDYYNHNSVESYFSIFNSNLTRQGFDMRRNLSVAWDTVGKYSTDLYTEEAVRLINAHNTNDSMFLYLAHLAPHSGNENDPMQAPVEEIAKFSYITDPKRRIYAAMVSKLDQSVGEVVEALKNRRMLENSIILFMSDNGAATEGYLANHGSNYPFRGIKGSLWEGAVRGAAAIWSPLIKKRERVSDQLMFMTDWLPTLLSAAGMSKKSIPKVDGYDMWPVLVSDEISRRHEVVINIDDITGFEAIHHGNFKYVNGTMLMNYSWIGDSGNSINEKRPPYDPENILRSKAGIAIAQVQTAEQILKRKISADTEGVTTEILKGNKLTLQKILHLRRQAQIHCNVTEEEKIPCEPSISPCLFNIRNDPCEMINIIKQQPLIATSMEYALAKHRLRVVPPNNKELDPLANPIYWNNTWSCWKDPRRLLMSILMIGVDDSVQKQNNTRAYSGTSIVIITVLFALSIIASVSLFSLYCFKKSGSYNFEQSSAENNYTGKHNNTQSRDDPVSEIIQDFWTLDLIRTIEDMMIVR